MAKKEILFEGIMNGALSQIYSTQNNGAKKFYLLQHIKKSEMKNEFDWILKYNQGKKPEDKLDLVTKQVKNLQYDFIIGQIPEELAKQYVKQNETKNHIKAGSMIQDVPKDRERNPYAGGRIKHAIDNLRDNRLESFVNASYKKTKVMTNARLKIFAGVMAGLMVLGGSSLAIQNMNQSSGSDGFTTTTQTTTTTTIPRDGEKDGDPKEFISIDQLVLEENKKGYLTSDSVKALTQSIEGEISSLYTQGNDKAPKVVNWETLAGLFYAENTCAPTADQGDYVGIGQMGLDGIKKAIERANTLYNKAFGSGKVYNGDNYIINEICNTDVDAHAKILFEEAKNDPVLCGVLTGLYLADLSDRNLTKLQGNEIGVLLMYNGGEGNFEKFEKYGIISISKDKQTITIDVSKISLIQQDKNLTQEEKDKLTEKSNEMVSYGIKVPNFAEEARENPDLDIHVSFDEINKKIGPNDNYSKTPNTKQYENLPEGLVVVGYEQALSAQPGE